MSLKLVFILIKFIGSESGSKIQLKFNKEYELTTKTLFYIGKYECKIKKKGEPEEKKKEFLLPVPIKQKIPIPIKEKKKNPPIIQRTFAPTLLIGKILK